MDKLGRAMAQAVSCRPLTVWTQAQYLASLFGIMVKKKAALGPVLLWVLRVSPVSIIQAALRGCSFIYYRRYIIPTIESVNKYTRAVAEKL